MKNRVRVAAYAALLLGCLLGRASAEPLEADIALTVNPLVGRHEVSGNERDRFSFAPLPLGELVLRRGNDSLRVEGLPPIAFNYGNGPNTDIGVRTTRLSVLNATVRHAFAGGWFAGAGETVYTQHTDYVLIPPGYFVYNGGTYYPDDGSETEFSRVAGLRVEAGRTVRRGPNAFEFGAGVNPTMHGMDFLVVPTAAGFFCATPACPRTLHTFGNPEAATQVDGYARFAHRVSRGGEVLLGARYINLTAKFASTGALSDRNVGWAPVIGYRQRL